MNDISKEKKDKIGNEKKNQNHVLIGTSCSICCTFEFHLKKNGGFVIQDCQKIKMINHDSL